MNADVIVVGGGPAGASTAFQLASAGVDVLVLERSRFPRHKACAECLSPQASRILHAMGVLEPLQAAGSALRGMEVRSPEGVVARGDYAASHGYRGFRDTGLGVRRERLDEALLGAAARAGARIEHGWRVADVSRGGSRVTGVEALDESGARGVFRARFVVGADGLRSVVARRLGLHRQGRWPARVALVAHYRAVRGVGGYVEMHVERDGFVGIADVGGGVTTVAAVFPAARARAFGPDRSAFLEGWLASRPHLRARIAEAVRVDTAQAVGPFASHTRRAWAPGALLVGDAADFYDPFTGEGVYAALRGGELAAGALQAALARDADAEAELRAYDRMRRREFGGKWRLERLVAAGVALPPVVNRAVRAMARRKPLADLLAGVTGDFVPANLVLRPSYLAQLLVAPVAGASSS